jgi:hypothetical protein
VDIGRKLEMGFYVPTKFAVSCGISLPDYLFSLIVVRSRLGNAAPSLSLICSFPDGVSIHGKAGGFMIWAARSGFGDR